MDRGLGVPEIVYPKELIGRSSVKFYNHKGDLDVEGLRAAAIESTRLTTRAALSSEKETADKAKAAEKANKEPARQANKEHVMAWALAMEEMNGEGFDMLAFERKPQALPVGATRYMGWPLPSFYKPAISVEWEKLKMKLLLEN